MKKSILIIQKLYDEQIDNLKEIAPDYEILQSFDEEQADSIEIILGWDDSLIPFLESGESNVQWIQFPFAGVNKLPLELFEKKSITLTNGSGIHKHSVTETIMGLLLGITRNIVASAHNQVAEVWDQSLPVFDLKDKTMMIIGAGKIGVQLGRVAKAFDMKTIGINRSGRKIEQMDEQYAQAELPAMISQGDVVVNILPLTKETHHLYDADMFAKMKDGVIFINVGRGESVDTEALIAALDSGKVSRAGLDVYEEEPLPAGHPLWSHDLVIGTPHTAGNVESYPNYLYPLFTENLKAYLAGEDLPQNVVELNTGY